MVTSTFFLTYGCLSRYHNNTIGTQSFCYTSLDKRRYVSVTIERWKTSILKSILLSTYIRRQPREPLRDDVRVRFFDVEHFVCIWEAHNASVVPFSSHKGPMRTKYRFGSLKRVFCPDNNQFYRKFQTNNRDIKNHSTVAPPQPLTGDFSMTSQNRWH